MNEEQTGFKFKIPTSAILDGGLNGFDLSVLYWIRYFEYKQDIDNRCMINATNLWYALSKNVDGIDLRFRGMVNSSVKKLYKKGYISVFDVLGGNTFLLNTTFLNDLENEGFIFVRSTDLHTILFNGKSINNYNLFKYFCCLLSTFRSKITLGNNVWTKCPVGFSNINEISQLASVCEDTAYKYNKVLEELKLIHIYRTNDTYENVDEDTGEIKEEHITNTYGRYENKDLIDEVAAKHIQEYGFIYNKKYKKNVPILKANQGRSLTMTYRWFCQDPNKYSTDEIRELYLGLLDYNKKKKKDNRKDLTVFKGYSFYKEEHEEDNDVDVKSDLLERGCD